jgi:hypothetical protein
MAGTRKLTRYSGAIERLTHIPIWLLGQLSAVEQANLSNLHQLIMSCEGVLEREREAWLSPRQRRPSFWPKLPVQERELVARGLKAAGRQTQASSGQQQRSEGGHPRRRKARVPHHLAHKRRRRWTAKESRAIKTKQQQTSVKRPPFHTQ